MRVLVLNLIFGVNTTHTYTDTFYNCTSTKMAYIAVSQRE